METYTKKEVDILINYYTPQIIGNPVATNLSSNYKINKFEIEYVKKNKAVIYCISEANNNIFKRRLIEYIIDYRIVHPNIVLTNAKKNDYHE